MGLNLTGSIPFRFLEIRPTGSISLTRSSGQTVDFYVTVGSSSSIQTASHDRLRQVDLSFAPEVRIPIDINATIGGGSIATLTPRLTCQQLSKTTTTRHCGQSLVLGLETISNNGLTTVFVGTSFDQMGGQQSTSVDFTVIKRW